MKTTLLLFLISFGIANAASNSKGPDSAIAVGKITAIAPGGKSITILQGGELKREIAISESTKITYVGMVKSARKLNIGYGVKAKVTDGTAKSINLTQPTKSSESLGDKRHEMTVREILTKSDDNKDGSLDYVESSRWIYHSDKHGADKFAKMDKNNSGGLDEKELGKLLAEVSWWKYSRKPAAAWFKAADKNNDNSLDLKEFTTIASGKNHAENGFKKVDKNKNKKISEKEATTYIAGILSSRAQN